MTVYKWHRLICIAVTDMNEDISVGNIFNSFLSDWTDLSNSQSIGSFFGVAIGPDAIVACGIDGLIATRDNSNTNLVDYQFRMRF